MGVIHNFSSFSNLLGGSSKSFPIRKNAGAIDTSFVPFGLPLRSDVQKRTRSNQERRRDQVDAPRILASTIFDCPEKRREKESAESAGCTNQTCENSNAFWETLGNQLKNCAISHAEHAHSQEQEHNFKSQRRQRADGKKTQ